MRRGDYLGTFTGKQFWPLDPQPEEVCLEDISHALSQICRFNGHTKEPYSVALHCLNVERLLEQRGYDDITRLYGLLHDAAEAYVCDLPRPLKRFVKNYGSIEFGVMDVIYDHFSLDWPSEKVEAIIREADDYILSLEAQLLMTNIDSWALVPTLPGDRLYTFEKERLNDARLIESFYRLRVTALLTAV